MSHNSKIEWRRAAKKTFLKDHSRFDRIYLSVATRCISFKGNNNLRSWHPWPLSKVFVNEWSMVIKKLLWWLTTISRSLHVGRQSRRCVSFYDSLGNCLWALVKKHPVVVLIGKKDGTPWRDKNFYHLSKVSLQGGFCLMIGTKYELSSMRISYWQKVILRAIPVSYPIIIPMNSSKSMVPDPSSSTSSTISISCSSPRFGSSSSKMLFRVSIVR